MTDDDFAELFRKPNTSASGSSWEDVAKEFQALGETLGEAVRAAWQRTDNDQRMRELHDSLNSMIEDVNRTVEQSATTPEAQQAREQFARLDRFGQVGVGPALQSANPILARDEIGREMQHRD